MSPKRNTSPLAKWILARYVRWLEAFGFFFIAVIVSGMIGSTIYKIDDTAKFTAIPATPLSEVVAVDAPSLIKAVHARAGERVGEGQPLAALAAAEGDLALLAALLPVQQAADMLDNPPEDAVAPPPAFVEAVQAALKHGKTLADQAPVTPLNAPIDGVFQPDDDDQWSNMTGRIVEGRLATIQTYDSLRFSVPVAGDNALRVRINLLAEQDVLDWRELTRIIKSETPPDDPAARRVWSLLEGKLADIAPAKKPLKRDMPEIVGALNALLRRTDFHTPEAWPPATLPDEARELLEQGTETLHTDTLVRLNRLLIRQALPDALGESANEYQTVKAKLYIPTERTDASGKTVAGKPIIHPTIGKVYREQEGGRVVVDLDDPPAEIVEYMKRRKTEDPDLPAVTCSGTIVVGRISLFRFLFK